MFTVVIEDRLKFSTFDKPNIDGVLHRDGIVQGSVELAFVTVRIMQDTNDLILDETVATQATDSFNITFDLAVSERSYGALFVAAFPLETGITATLNGAIDDLVTTVNLSVSVGLIPLSGWLKITGSDEIMSFTKVTATQVLVQRGIFNTVATSHLDTAGVNIAAIKETATPYRQFQVEDDYFITTGRQG